MNDQAQQQLRQLEGLPLIPVKAVRGDKRPIGEAWEQNPKSHTQIASMNGQVRMVGLLLNDRFTAVDIDGPVVGDWLEENYGVNLAMPSTWVVSSGREGRCAGIFEKPSPEQLQRLAAAGVKATKNISIKTEVSIPDPEHDASGAADKKQGIEVRFNGQQVVLGQHPSTHDLHYRWLNGDPGDVAPLPDVVIDLLIKHHQFVEDEKAERRGSRGVKAVEKKKKRKGFVNLPEEKAPNEPDWWGLSNGERLTCLAEKWLDKKDGNGYEPWMHICSLMKASIEQNEIDSVVAVEAFLAFSRRMPGFVDDNDCLNKFEAMDEGSFEDALGLLIEKGKDGGLVLPPRPKTTQQTPKSPVAQMGIEEVEDNLRRAIDQSSDAASMAVLIAELAHASPFSQSAIKEIGKRMQEASDTEIDRKARAAALSKTSEIEAEFNALELGEFLPARVAEALKTTAEGMPYPDHALLFTFLLGVASVLPLGMKVCMNRRTKFTPPLNLYLAEVGESGQKKTPKTSRVLKMPTSGVKEMLAHQFNNQIQDWMGRDKKERGPRPEALFIHLDNFTGEALCRKLQLSADRKKSLLIYREELRAVFDGLGVYKGGGNSGGEEELILELYDGNEHVQARVGGDRYFPSCQVSLGGCVQQAVLCELLAAKDDGNGKWARVLFYPMPGGVVVRLPDDEDLEALDRADRADQFLRELINGLSLMNPNVIQCTSEAKQWFADFEEQRQQRVTGTSEVSMRSLLNKSAGKVARLAGLLMLIEGGTSCRNLLDPECAPGQFRADYDPKGKVELKHMRAAAELVELSDRWTMSFHNAVASGGQGETVAAVDALEQRLQEISLKLGDWQSWKKIKEGLTPTQRKANGAERGKQLLQNLVDRGLGELKIGDRGGVLYRAFRGEGG